MKRTIAKEFLLLIGCIVVVLLVALFGWARNAWFEHRIESVGRARVEQVSLLDSLAVRVRPVQRDFLGLFEPDFVRNHCDVFLTSPSWTMEPFWVFTDDEFTFSMESPSPLPPFNRRYLMCVAKALDVEGYWSHDRVNRLAMKCGQPANKLAQLAEMLNSSMAERKSSWRPPADAAEIYNPTAPKIQMTTWEKVLGQMGVSQSSMDSSLIKARSDTSGSIPLLIAVRGLLCDTVPCTELRSAFEYLREHHVLRCNVYDLLYTLQDKAAPPSQEALDAFARQKATIDGLVREQESARASLWSEARQWAFVKWATIILLALLYPLRFLLLGTRWALRTLRE